MAGGTASDAFIPSAYLNGAFLPRGSVVPHKVFYRRFGAFFYFQISHYHWRKIIMDNPVWKNKEYSFFSHKKCEYFPCHQDADPDNFNCLFCYCPLYALGDKCGGNFRITTKGIKDCSSCLIPHKRENYGYITGKYQELVELMKSQGTLPPR